MKSRAQADVALKARAAEVEPPVAEPQRLVDVLLVELERERRGARDDRQLVDRELDGTGRHPVVDGLRRARDELAARLQHELVADLPRQRRRLRRPLGVDHELRDARAVTEVDEHEPAVVATARSPACEGQLPAHVLGARLTAHEVAPAHGESLETISS